MGEQLLLCFGVSVDLFCFFSLWIVFFYSYYFLCCFQMLLPTLDLSLTFDFQFSLGVVSLQLSSERSDVLWKVHSSIVRDTHSICSFRLFSYSSQNDDRDWTCMSYFDSLFCLATQAKSSPSTLKIYRSTAQLFHFFTIKVYLLCLVINSNSSSSLLLT